MQSAAKNITVVERYSENYPSGKLKVTGSAGVGDDGRYLKHGKETWYYENGRRKWEAHYELGKKVGSEMYWRESGQKLWSWNNVQDGRSVWTHWWPNGEKKSESTWVNKKCEGVAKTWSPSGKLLNQFRFEEGVMVETP
jgi:antitoxin component YwqK of YwqJK toxin-antitoxin module